MEHSAGHEISDLPCLWRALESLLRALEVRHHQGLGARELSTGPGAHKVDENICF